MTYPAGVQLATLTFSNPTTFLGNSATRTEMTVHTSAGVVWAATGEPIDDFDETVAPGPGMPGSLTVPFVDQPGFTDQAGNNFTMWAYTVTRRTVFGNSAKTVTKHWQPVLGQSEAIDFDQLPGGTIGLPVSAPIVPVTSVAGETGVVGAESLATALVEFLPEAEPITPEAVEANLPERLETTALNATIASATEGLAKPSAFSPLKFALDAGKTCALGMSGDSTGNETAFTAEWVSLFAQGLAARYPAYTVAHRIWDDATQAFAAPVMEQTGPAGARSVRLTKTLIVDAAAVKHIPGDIDVRVKVSLDDWTPAAQNTLVGRFGATGSRAWRMYISTNGFLYFEWSVDGTTLITKNTGVVVGAADGAVKWVRATLDVDNGSAGNELKFYTSDDGAVWTQLGATITTAGVTSIFEPVAQPWELGGYAQTSFVTAGQIYEVQIREGIAGPIRCPVLPDLWQVRDDTSYTFTGAPVLTIVNGSHPGANLGYLNDATRLPKLHPDYGQVNIMFSDSHNENWAVGDAWRVKYEAWLDAVRTLRPLASLVLSTQNHRKAPAANIGAHADRQQIIRAVAVRRGHGLIDAFKGFAGDDSLVQSDGIHPTKGAGSGSQVWADQAIALFDASA